MEQTIRLDVFETNSSSEHSLVIKDENDSFYTQEEVREDLEKHIVQEYVNEFSSYYFIDFRSANTYKDLLLFSRAPFAILTTYFDKLRYVLAHRNCMWDDERYSEFEKYICDKYNLDFHFIFDKDPWDDNSDYHGEVDHQSQDLLNKVFEKLNYSFDNFDDIDKFLCNKKYAIIIDGDEYGITDSYKQSGLIKGKIYTEYDLRGNEDDELL